MVELPLVVSMKTLVKLCNLGVPRQTPGRIDDERLVFWFEKHRITGMPRDTNGYRYFEVFELEEKWPTFVAGIKARLSRFADGPAALQAIGDDSDEAA